MRKTSLATALAGVMMMGTVSMSAQGWNGGDWGDGSGYGDGRGYGYGDGRGYGSGYGSGRGDGRGYT